MTYIALIGDIIQSKQLTDRSKVQKTLAAYLDDLNKTFAPYIISKLSLTLGDEFQGLFLSGLSSLENGLTPNCHG